ncbi:MAG: serine/threonine-protein phosphatase [Burkholderiales bacterium]|nr:serine/threonine-protein phosphatase [Burkholderiales bacterium]
MGDFLEVAALTDVGNVRQYNEDSLGVDAGAGIVVLADGMGGHRAGEVASVMATDTIFATVRAAVPAFDTRDRERQPLTVLARSIERANAAIHDAGRAEARYRGMGTTLACAIFHDNGVAYAHVGDSRIYRLRDDTLSLLTRDDSLLRDQVDLGVISADEARHSHNRSLVTRALGIEAEVRAHLASEPVQPGDVYLLCSDGLNDLVDDADIELIVTKLAANLPLAAQHLVQAAKDNGGLDNVSVILARVRAPFAATPPGVWRRLRRILATWRGR